MDDNIGCFSQSESKLVVKLSTDEIIECAYMGDTTCDDVLSGFFVPADSKELKSKNIMDIMNQNIDRLQSNEWAMIRLYGTDYYTDIYPSKNKRVINEHFFINHFDALESYND